MMEFLKSWVLNIVALGLLIVVFEIIAPSGKIKKFINLIAGFILIIAVINPFVSFFSKGFSFKDVQLTDSNALDQKEMEQQSKNADEKQKQQIVEVYKSRIKNRIEDTVKGLDGVSDAKANIVIDEDYESESFGSVKGVSLEIINAPSDKDIKPVSKVSRVEIGKDKQAVEETKEIDMDLKNKIEEKLSRLFDIDKSSIAINAGWNSKGVNLWNN